VSKSKRVDVGSFKQMLDSLPDGELDRLNQLQHEQTIDEHNRFVECYKEGECYLCNKSFKTISKNNPCIHWLLRRCKFKSKDFNKVYSRFDYHQIMSYLRWVANQERFQGNINDLDEEKSDNKLIETTIKWKNIEWTFNCSLSDYSGHGGSHSNFPHYHFQMRIDGRPFINFNQHHIPFSDKDLFNLDILQQKPEMIYHSFGPGGSGMQDAVEVDPEDIIQHTVTTEKEEDATYHMQSVIMAKDKDKPLKGEDIQAMIEESKNTGKPLASLIDKHFGDTATQKTIISPVDTIADIAKRSGRKKK
jgi:hypothetical protein